ncbi:chaperone NapD [Litchfieldella xinjiangensis]|uniref:chaperone NapD n=1 Tax=Litchfieldella xinjiangensis TaxID=1166948 RepID=UPI0006944426|nr:chaperone NapD [Halomonas xinjiangensis]
MNDNIHISSLVVQARPERVAAIAEYCRAAVGVEVHVADPGGKLVLVIEAGGQRETVDFIDALQGEPGVLSASMVYHHVESAQELNRELNREMEGEASHEADAT